MISLTCFYYFPWRNNAFFSVLDKDKNLNPTPNREKHLKCLGFPKRKGPSCKERPAKVARAETAKQLRNPQPVLFLDS